MINGKKVIVVLPAYNASRTLKQTYDEICDALRTAIEQSSNKVECLGHGVGYTVREIFDKFLEVNEEALYQHTDEAILRKIGPRRKGDAPYSVLEDVSPYMKNLYSIDELLRLP